MRGGKGREGKWREEDHLEDSHRLVVGACCTEDAITITIIIDCQTVNSIIKRQHALTGRAHDRCTTAARTRDMPKHRHRQRVRLRVVCQHAANQTAGGAQRLPTERRLTLASVSCWVRYQNVVAAASVLAEEGLARGHELPRRSLSRST